MYYVLLKCILEAASSSKEVIIKIYQEYMLFHLTYKTHVCYNDMMTEGYVMI